MQGAAEDIPPPPVNYSKQSEKKKRVVTFQDGYTQPGS